MKLWHRLMDLGMSRDLAFRVGSLPKMPKEAKKTSGQISRRAQSFVDTAKFYGWSLDDVGLAVLRYDSFVSVDHPGKLYDAMAVFGEGNRSRIIDAIRRNPNFVGHDIFSYMARTIPLYGSHNAERFKNAVLRAPSIMNIDHARSLSDAEEVFGSPNADRIRDAVLRFPQFITLNHARVLRHKSRIGRLVGLSSDEVVRVLLERPVLAGYAPRRDLAVLDVARRLSSEGYILDDDARDYFIRHHSISPYVPTTRLRLSQIRVVRFEPSLLSVARKHFETADYDCRGS